MNLDFSVAMRKPMFSSLVETSSSVSGSTLMTGFILSLAATDAKIIGIHGGWDHSAITWGTGTISATATLKRMGFDVPP